MSDAKQPGLRRVPGPGTAAWVGCEARRKGKQGTIIGPGRALVPAQELLTGRDKSPAGWGEGPCRGAGGSGTA